MSGFPILRQLLAKDDDVVAMLNKHAYVQAILEAYAAGSEAALIMEDDMHVLRWPDSTLIATAPPDWDILLLYMMGPEAEAIYL